MTIMGLDGSALQKGVQVPKAQVNGISASAAIRALECIDPDKIQVLEYRVLLKVVSVEEITDGGILKPESFFEKELFNKTEAVFIACGEEAFTKNGDFIQNRPEKGDLVITTKYAGNVYRDKDYNLYRFANDQDVVAIVRGDE
jgi:co-chaperonin GroES (HSP10)